MLVRPVSERDLPGILEHFRPTPPGRLSEGAARAYGELKAWLHVTTPGAYMLAGWVDDNLAGVVYFRDGPVSLPRRVMSFTTFKWLARKLFTWPARDVGQLLMWGFRRSLHRLAGLFRLSGRSATTIDSTAPYIHAHAGLITDVFTVPVLRGLGVAKALLAAAEAVLRERGATRVALYVASDNEPAFRLYEARGYGVVAVCGAPGAHHFLMVKELPSIGTATNT
ncbi:MAG: GNAT family N-acetyltransferase [Armatimonadetes bacterium]|nr:GNAT family N-acetyltransferase [Armatimonadota bacterium]